MLTPVKSAAKAPIGFWLIIFSSINALLMTLISLNLGSGSSSLIGKLYFVCAMTTQFFAISFALALLGYLLTGFMSSLKWRMRICIALFILAQLIVIINLKVYALYHFHLNGMVVNLFLGGALLENLSFSAVMWASVTGVLLAIILIEYLMARAALKYSANRKLRIRTAVISVIVAMLAIQLLNGFADAFAWKEITLQNRYIPWMKSTTMRKQLARLGFTITKETNTAFSSELSALQYPLQPLACSTIRAPNILMLVVDSLRADMYTPEIMPNTTDIGKTALVFNNHFSTGNATRYGLFGLMYGLTGNYWKAMLVEERGSVLFDITQEMHYQHFIYGSSRLSFPEFDRTVFSRLRNQLHQGAEKTSADNDADIARKLIKDIEGADPQKPFFGFAFFDAPHGFSLPKDYPHRFEPMLEQVNYMSLHNDYDPTPFMNLYKTAVHYVDGLIAEIYRELARKNLLDNTLIIITSDHGQEFNETRQNYWGHNSNFSRWQTKVPLVIHWPGLEPRTFAQLTSHEDVIPTLLQNALGCSTPIENFSTGKNLLGDLNHNRSLLFESWTERAIKYDDKIYLFNSVGNSSTLDDNYQTQNNDAIPAKLLQENLQRMSQFMKK
ncbi:MAG TPA: sulfatase-like hydrolase/transferase [Cellvibrio sp.]|nr:sulfatase-like hydrolase/transferase [Cellvibrio sp.]